MATERTELEKKFLKGDEVSSLLVSHWVEPDEIISYEKGIQDTSLTLSENFQAESRIKENRVFPQEFWLAVSASDDEEGLEKLNKIQANLILDLLSEASVIKNPLVNAINLNSSAIKTVLNSMGAHMYKPVKIVLNDKSWEGQVKNFLNVDGKALEVEKGRLYSLDIIPCKKMERNKALILGEDKFIGARGIRYFKKVTLIENADYLYAAKISLVVVKCAAVAQIDFIPEEE